MGVFISVDIGGTQIRAASFPADSTQPISMRRIPTRSDEGTAFDRMCGLIESVWPENDSVLAIVVAIPGPDDPETGVIFSAPNIPGWENFPIRAKLEDRFKAPIHIGNDANLAALGEWKFGAGQGHKHLIYLTISTGIGGGVISGNHLLTGLRGLATELGHITVLPDGPLCGCGQRGHLEAVAAGPGIARYVNERIAAGEASSIKPHATLSAREVYEAAQQGDALAIAAFARAGEFIGHALADLLHIFNPSIVIFGGGVSQTGDLLLKPVREALPKYVMDPSYLKDLVITTAALKDDAGLLGALALARTKHDN
jgi:glucokinase